MGAAGPARRLGAPERLWPLHFLRAGVALALGVSVLALEDERPLLANFIAFYWLIGGVLTIRWAVANRPGPGHRLALAAALLVMLAAVLVLLRFSLAGALSSELTLRLLGVAAILTGVLRLAGAFRDDLVAAGRPRLPHRAVVGTLELALGIVLLVAHGESRAIGIVAGVWGLAGGTLLLLDALALRRRATRAGHGRDASRWER